MPGSTLVGVIGALFGRRGGFASGAATPYAPQMIATIPSRRTSVYSKAARITVASD